MERMYFIVNPTAGSGRAKTGFAEICTVLDAAGADYGYVFTKRRGHGTELAAAAVTMGEKFIISVGGDGTNREVASALVNTGVKFGLIPLGTGNDLARVLGIPENPMAAFELLKKSHVRKMDVGTANGLCFVNVSGFGFDVDTLINTERYKVRFNGMLPYTLGVLRALLKPRTLHLTVHHDGGTFKMDSLLVSVGNGQYIGGGMRAVPQADPFDGTFDVCVVKKVSVLRFLSMLPGYVKGEHVGYVDVVKCFKTKKLTVECPEDSLINYDGELYSGTPVSYEILPAAIDVVVNEEFLNAAPEPVRASPPLPQF